MNSQNPIAVSLALVCCGLCFESAVAHANPDRILNPQIAVVMSQKMACELIALAAGKKTPVSSEAIAYAHIVMWMPKHASEAIGALRTSSNYTRISANVLTAVTDLEFAKLSALYQSIRLEHDTYFHQRYHGSNELRAFFATQRDLIRKEAFAARRETNPSFPPLILRIEMPATWINQMTSKESRYALCATIFSLRWVALATEGMCEIDIEISDMQSAFSASVTRPGGGNAALTEFGRIVKYAESAKGEVADDFLQRADFSRLVENFIDEVIRKGHKL